MFRLLARELWTFLLIRSLPLRSSVSLRGDALLGVTKHFATKPGSIALFTIFFFFMWSVLEVFQK